MRRWTRTSEWLEAEASEPLLTPPARSVGQHYTFAHDADLSVVTQVGSLIVAELALALRTSGCTRIWHGYRAYLAPLLSLLRL